MELFDRLLGFHYVREMAFFHMNVAFFIDFIFSFGFQQSSLSSSGSSTPAYMDPIRSAVVVPGVLLIFILM